MNQIRLQSERSRRAARRLERINIILRVRQAHTPHRPSDTHNNMRFILLCKRRHAMRGNGFYRFHLLVWDVGKKSCLTGPEPVGPVNTWQRPFLPLPFNFLCPINSQHTHTLLHGGSYPPDSIHSPPPLPAEARLTITSSLLITSAKTFFWRLQLHVQTLQRVVWHKLCLRRCMDEIWSREARVETLPRAVCNTLGCEGLATGDVGRRK